MTKIIIEKINCVEDLYMFSKAFKEGMIQINITKVAKLMLMVIHHSYKQLQLNMVNRC